MCEATAPDHAFLYGGKQRQTCTTSAVLPGLGPSANFQLVDATFQQQAALQEVLSILDRYRDEGKLNNENIARLVRNYFYEMCFVTYELARLLRPGGTVAMVNDNVRYAGEEVPADLILSDFARTFGLTVRHIWTLGRGKGNSSQRIGKPRAHRAAQMRLRMGETSAPCVDRRRSVYKLTSQSVRAAT